MRVTIRLAIVPTIAFSFLSLTATWAKAQCQGNNQSPGNTALTSYGNTAPANQPYSQMGLGNGYNTLGMNSSPYSNSFLGNSAAANALHQNARLYAAMRVQASSEMVRNQVAQTQAMRKNMARESAQIRKQREQDRAEMIALRR